MDILSTALTNPTKPSAGKLFIEQEEYGETDGFLSRAGLHMALLALLGDDVVDEPVCTHDCGTWLNVYRYDFNLNYRLHVSRGVLGNPVRQETFYAEKVKVSMQDEVSLKYPCFGVIASRWLGGKVWDKTGASIPAPGYSVLIDKIKFAAPVYGTLLLVYRVIRDRYGLALMKREEAEENKYSCIAYAIHRGGPTWIKVKPPPGAEETEQQCTGGGGGGVEIPTPDPDDDPPHAPNKDAKRVRDYCTQEVLSDTSK